MKRGALILAIVLASVDARADTEDDARALVDAWVAAQNDSDFDAYLAFYAKGFVGIKRTGKGSEKKLKLAKWKADRKKMFKSQQEVAAEDIEVAVTDDGATVTFLQRWRGGGYSDHGAKVLTLTTGKTGLQIVAEEMRYSVPGWDDGASTVVDATHLVAPIAAKVAGRMPSSWKKGTCGTATFYLTLTDAEGTVVEEELGQGGLAATKQTMAIGAYNDDGILYAVGPYACDEPDFEIDVKQSGDALVVLSGTVEDPIEGATSFDVVKTILLPERAKVKAR